MYKLQLIRKYLVKRRIAWVALVAVMLCTAMVLIVVSVMGGWLATFKESFHAMTGDVIVSGSPLTGFAYYQDMIVRIDKVPGVVASAPVIRTGAMMNSPMGPNFVQVIAYPPNIGQILPWPKTLNHPPKISAGPASTMPAGANPYFPDKRVKDRKGEFNRRPAVIVSSLVIGLTHDKSEEYRRYVRSLMGRWNVTLTMLPVAPGEQINIKTDSVTVGVWIADDSKSQLWQLDNSTIYMDFDEAQADLHMVASVDPDGHVVSPARCSEIQIKAAPGADLIAIRDRVRQIVEEVDGAPSHAAIGRFQSVSVDTWMERPATFIQAVEKEVVLTTALFGIISLVAVLLIFCIFYMIVLEKTKDIGILKSVGATGAGILGLFLGYGLAIGVTGAGLGFTAAFFVVRYINEIHAWLGRRFGIVIFTPETYQFDRIPSTMEPRTVSWVIVVAILSAMVGAFLPALRAATMNPIDALRYE
jgi:lipoprotein-releasing system permease protein